MSEDGGMNEDWGWRGGDEVMMDEWGWREGGGGAGGGQMEEGWQDSERRISDGGRMEE